ncbi:hypothetical protein A8990_12117 [Paenibacillus taihuensis]|uniref:Uncharacterized protein n=1 Tax=Paenibacillus taihuensis TaxID=1156355 RepID=A0A3D9RKU7_9BACL|nr:hypothetical protein A8990_12117 [Paenibacillus taihuensis]
MRASIWEGIRFESLLCIHKVTNSIAAGYIFNNADFAVFLQD